MSHQNSNLEKIKNLESKTNRNLVVNMEQIKNNGEKEDNYNPEEKQIKKNNEIKETDTIKDVQNKKKLINIIILSSSIFLIILICIILLIGYFFFGWFQKKENLIIQMKKNEKLVMRYLEVKNATSYYDIEGLKEEEKRKDDSIITDLIFGINKKTKTSYFGEIDYLYEAFLLIINMTKINETNYENLGGLNIYEESQSIDELIEESNDLFYENINTNNTNISNIPFCKFYFYENGTIKDIHFPNNTNDFYKSAIIDLIEKIIPKLSSSLYNLKDNRRRLEKGEEGIYLNYEENDKNGEIINVTLYEDRIEKNLDKDNNGFNFETSELNSNYKRIINSSGVMTSLEMGGQVSFIGDQMEKENKTTTKNSDEKNIKTNSFFYKLGYNQFKMNISSNMILLSNKIEVKTLKNLNILSEKFNFEKTINLNSTTKEEQKEEKTKNKNQQLNKKRQLVNEPNYSNSYKFTYNLITTSFLGLNIGLDQGLYINNITGLRKGYIETIIGEKRFTLSNINYYYNPYEKKGEISKELIDEELEGLSKDFKVFGFLINADLNLKFNADHCMEYGKMNDELYTKSLSSFDVSVEGTFGPKFIVFSFGVSLTGHIVTGEASIQAKTLLNNNSNLARVEYYKNINSCAVDISFYFSVYLLFYEKKYSKDIRIYEGFSFSENYYKDV